MVSVDVATGYAMGNWQPLVQLGGSLVDMVEVDGGGRLAI